MDPVTHAALGATVSLAGFRRRLGRRAMAWGAVAAMLPDADIVVGWVEGPFANWLHHRGLTHSVFFAVAAGPLLGWAVWRLGRRRERDTLPLWMGLMTAVLATHPLIDLITHYGTQMLAPFSDHRFAIPALPIIDPAFTLILLAAVLAGALTTRRAGMAVAGAWMALLACWAYALGGWAMNERAAEAARQQLAAAGIAVERVDAYPTIFQPYLRRVVAQGDGRVGVGYVSVLNGRPIAWTWAEPARSPAVRAVAGTEEARILAWFAGGQVLWREVDGEVLGTDLRYGYPNGSELGMWGVQAPVTAEGALAGPPRMMRRRTELNRENLERLWRLVLG